MSEKWIYSNNEEAWNISEEYNTREEAIRDGRETAKEEGWFNLFVARAVPIYLYPDITPTIKLYSCEDIELISLDEEEAE